MLPNTGMSFTPFDPLPASDLNDLVENIEALSDGTGIINNAILTRHIAASQVTLPKVDLTTFPSVTAYKTSAQSSINGNALVQLNVEEHDQGSNFSTSTYLFTTPVTGKYHISYGLYLQTNTGRCSPGFYKNGSMFLVNSTLAGGNFISANGSLTLSLTAGDTIGLGIRSDGVYPLSVAWNATDPGCYMSINRVG